MIRNFFLCCLALVSVTLAGCGGGSVSTPVEVIGDTIPMTYARRLVMTEGDGWTKVSIINPWDTTRMLQEYVLVPDSVEMPADCPEGIVVRTPVKSLVVQSTVHCRLLYELGAADAIKGVCDAPFISLPRVKEGLGDGSVADCGRSTDPDIERLLSLRPDAVMMSPFPDSGSYGKLEMTGVPVIECADYTEPSPLGRAEWVRFYGRLLGREAEADSMFRATSAEYERLRAKALEVKEHPGVIFDHIYSGQWYVPARDTATAMILRDAGASNLFDFIEGTENVPVAPEQVLVKGWEAPLWLVRYTAEEPLSRSEMLEEYSLYRHFRAFETGEIYACETTQTHYFDLTPFHPDILLGTLIALVHPELGVGENRFFEKLK